MPSKHILSIALAYQQEDRKERDLIFHLFLVYLFAVKSRNYSLERVFFAFFLWFDALNFNVKFNRDWWWITIGHFFFTSSLSLS